MVVEVKVDCLPVFVWVERCREARVRIICRIRMCQVRTHEWWEMVIGLQSGASEASLGRLMRQTDCPIHEMSCVSVDGIGGERAMVSEVNGCQLR